MSDGIIESSDINDKDILTKTTMIPCANGGKQFKFKMPDGSDLKSECVGQDNMKTALHRWPEMVRNQIVVRAQIEREEIEASQRRARKDAQLAAADLEEQQQGIIVPGRGAPPRGTASPASPSSSAAPSLTGYSPSVPSAMPSSADPVAMARAELVNASLEVQQLSPLLAAAQQRVAQWKAVLTALQGVELPRESTVIDSNTQLRDVLSEK